MNRVLSCLVSFEKVEKILADANASAVSTEKLGKKLLSYPIKKQAEGEYFLFNFEAEGEAANNIASTLRLEQDLVLRYLIIRKKESKRRKKHAAKAVETTEEEEVKTKKVTKTTKKETKK